ncbi:MAG: sigma-54 dependent transcriptional regulator, partial [Desulfobacterales bacterium]
MPRMGGMEILSRIKQDFPDTIVIVITGFASVSSAVEVMKKGAYDYLPKPFTPHELRAVVAQALNHYKIKMQNKALLAGPAQPTALSHQLIGDSPQIKTVISMIRKVAHTESTVLIHGESGTGKELVARAIHEAGPRRDKPFIKVNCAALNDNLLESELFGHVKGAFTGADRNRIGRFEAAHEGTIFLDEIGDIPSATQVKLLRVLEDKKIERVGDIKTVPVDVRIITATNKNLESLVETQVFREDLFFRINVFPLHCPALADRREDIPLIVEHFIRQNAGNSSKQILGVTPKAMEALMSYGWPGNVRELRNAIDYAYVLCPGGGIDKDHLPVKIR